MKRLSLFSIKSFIGPFLVTFAISMFILIMQFFWKYIDDLMGKGIETIYILELLFYVSASLIPMALPLAMLLSSIMTMGNLAENNELTALKASGLSLWTILRPLTNVVLLIALGTFLFANYVIPVANYKWHALIYDFQNTKINSLIVPGVYSSDLGDFTIKAQSKDEHGSFLNLTIHDRSRPDELKTVKAERGTLYKADNGKYLFFNLEKGYMVEELMMHAPVFDEKKVRVQNGTSSRETRRSEFYQATYKIDISNLAMSRTNAETFKNDFEMLTVFQLDYALDSVKRSMAKVNRDFSTTTKNTHELFQGISYQKHVDSLKTQSTDTIKERIYFDKLSQSEQNQVYQLALTKLDTRLQTLEGQKTFLKSVNRTNNRYLVEFHRKFALTYAIIILFFVGAPLGAIIRKGGFGAPVVVAALLFMLYFILISAGESLVESESATPFWGMWFASVILTPIAVILMFAAANDKAIFAKETWMDLYKIITFQRKKKKKAL